jgi:hypothetical protein
MSWPVAGIEYGTIGAVGASRSAGVVWHNDYTGHPLSSSRGPGLPDASSATAAPLS